MDVLLSLATGLGLRVYLIRATSPTSFVAPALLGLSEGALVHQLSFHPPPSFSSSPLDHYLAFGLRLVLDLLIAGNRSRVTMVALWALVGTLISESLFPTLSASFSGASHSSSHHQDHRKQRRRSRTLPSHIPPHIRMYREPQGSPPPLPFRAPEPRTSTPTQPTIQVHTDITQNGQVLMSPDFPPTPPSFFLHTEPEPSPLPDSPTSPKPTITTTLISSIPIRPPSALAFYEGEKSVPHKPSGGQASRSPTLPTPPDSTFRERTMDSRVDRLSTIDEITSRSEHVSEDIAQGEVQVEGDQNYILISHAGGVPLPIPNSTSRYVRADDTTPRGSVVPSAVPSARPPTAPLPIVPVSHRPGTPSEGSDELRTPGQPVYEVGPDSDPDELRTPPALRARTLENDTGASMFPRGPESRLSPLMLGGHPVAPDQEPIVAPGTTLSSYAILQPPVAPAPLGPLLDVITQSGSKPAQATERPSSPSETSVAESVLSARVPSKILDRADDLRKQAKKEEEELARLKRELVLAVSQKRARDALFLRGDIQDTEERITKLHQKAARRFFAGRNHDLQKPNSIDVHGLKPQEALRKTEQAFRDLLVNGQSTLNVIVGKGLHSKDGVPAIKNCIVREMQARHIPCKVDPFNAGVLILTLSSDGNSPNDGS